jgi:NodT family efflux transporter outer membrane factor (OMF) lipoprotein
MNRTMRTTVIFRAVNTALLAAGVLSGCAFTPAYERPATPQPAAFKELQGSAPAGWAPAAPADALDRGSWWHLFEDPVLDGLMRQVEIGNQNVAAAVAAYDQARATVAGQRGALFPSLTLNGGADRNASGGGSSNSGNNGGNNSGGRTSNSYRLNIGSSWEPDVWGRLRAGVAVVQANAQASAADLASARLSAQGELAADYFSLRSVDAQRALLATTIDGYRRVLKITQNRFDVGIVPHSDVYQAQTQLASAQSDDLALARPRAQFEHAIAVLIGKAPADFALAPAEWKVTVPDVPVGVPSALLERRPDIAAAERAVAAANAQIGIVRSAYFPQIGLSASYGPSASAIGDLFKASSVAWALGLSATETIFNGGANRAAVRGANAAREQVVARYRQAVLTAFADVEDQLAATRVLARQQDLQRQASAAADKVEEQVLNRYKAGQVSYSEVVQAQVTALNARRALVQTQGNRQGTAVALIQALGGGWHAERLAAQE